jgi:Isoleucyl-tRNA synthetase
MAPFNGEGTRFDPSAGFPETQGRGRKAIDQAEELLRLRGIIGQAIEHARQEKLIGNTLEARVF